MTKLIGLREIELPPGVEPDEYERLFAEEVASLPQLPGWKTHLLKGERGARAGKFLLLFEIDSIEARDRFFPGADERSEEWDRYVEQHPEIPAAWEKAGMMENNIWTDYVTVVE
jgi:hypothetical protein